MVAEAVNNSRNPNHSVLMGSIAGVRGLSDNLYRNRAQTYLNLGCGMRFKSPTLGAAGVFFRIGAFNRLPGERQPEGLDRHRQCRGRHQE